ncbi:DUF6479 family protein [Streptomyces sp. Ru72]|uniref:DUF6479 family protein n=1 Tax=Streptomyces sp. Ru72 TaxID=2080747 RepID=UPI000CDE2F05|nr:DUF6479 family protein [Streptomyces sp. Ru72]POX45394.1 hypothetical protein C3488_29945 [Streptomyces sp. Ru72]
MNTVSFAIQAAARDDRVVSQWTLSVFFILVGVVVAGALIWAVRLGMSVRDREPAPPRPEEQPHLPDGGPVLEEREVREPEEMPLAGQESERLMPYQLHHAASRRCDDQHRRRWLPGSSGGFGSGGPGHV